VHSVWNLVYAQPRFIAAWNTYLACRSTPQLLEHIAALRQDLALRMRNGFVAAFPEMAGQRDAEGFIGMVFSTLRGLGLLEMFKPANEANADQLQSLIDTIVRRCERGHGSRADPNRNKETP
jgi:hypothetical protein